MFRILFRAAAKAFKQLADKVVNILLRARTQDSLNNRLTITFLLWRLVRLDGDFMVAKLMSLDEVTDTDAANDEDWDLLHSLYEDKYSRVVAGPLHDPDKTVVEKIIGIATNSRLEAIDLVISRAKKVNEADEFWSNVSVKIVSAPLKLIHFTVKSRLSQQAAIVVRSTVCSYNLYRVILTMCFEPKTKDGLSSIDDHLGVQNATSELSNMLQCVLCHFQSNEEARIRFLVGKNS
jgi:hypothetical protein